MKWTISNSLPISFDIVRSRNVLSLKELDIARKIIIIDHNVYELYKDNIPCDSTINILTINCTEATKGLDNAQLILNFFETKNILRRTEPVIAIGGGVLLDIVGFCCSIYRRGIPYIRIPTTLLSIIDASIGIKTSINHFDRRNRLGSFYPPLMSILDTALIKTQTAREISNGVAEILKLSIVVDETLFELLENNPKVVMEDKFQGDLADQIIDIAINSMISELNSNLWEQQLQRSVDFGHSFSPIIEMKNVCDMLHGEAVILDCLLSSCISFNRNLISQDTLYRIFNLIKSYNLPTYHADFYNIDLLNKALTDTMKHRDNNQFLPIPTSIGGCIIINDLTQDELLLSTITMRQLNNKI